MELESAFAESVLEEFGLQNQNIDVNVLKALYNVALQRNSLKKELTNANQENFRLCNNNESVQNELRSKDSLVESLRNVRHSSLVLHFCFHFSVFFFFSRISNR
jgi:cell division protein FtsX